MADGDIRDVAAPYIYSVDSLFNCNPGAPGAWGPIITLSVEFANRARQTSLDKRVSDNLQKLGFRIMRDYFSPTLLSDARPPYSFMEDSLLLHYVTVPGDACDLGLENHCQQKFFDKELDEIFQVQYTPHNVDNKTQASCLLSLWLNWANSMKALLKS